MANAPQQAVASFGVKVHLSDGASPANFYELFNVRRTGPINRTYGKVETTAHNTADPDREHVLTLRDNGTFEVTVAWVPSHATHAGATSTYSLEYQWHHGSKRVWRVVSTDPSSLAYSFVGMIESFPVEGHEVDGLNERTVTVAISGPVVREYQFPA